MTATDKAQKASAAFALLIIAGFVVLVIYGSIKSFSDARAKSAEEASVMSEIERVEASSDAPALKSRKVLELAWSSWDVVSAVDAKYSENYSLNRVGLHVQAGYNLTEPLSPPIFDKAAELTCIIRVRQLDTKSSTFIIDNDRAYRSAKNDIEVWRPYLADYGRTWGNCAYRFRVMLERHMARLENEKSVSVKEIGAKVGQATNEVGKWWDSATKPLSDAVDEFKSGYNSGK
ncbi:hypothetical protein IFT59_07085 [Rhizobium sp. CFBP 8752]|uniref:hypothetical protein n=1 Tax=Rhizobium sp. CFBP 8752 TaxID=2775301 RepID=UPI001783D223|nr:hypothetical protein [Rhizobium sp. CFBP 8752]MBD8663015.1 hypothetical protein [Rhizobium sp. CFBP 8752]